MKKVGAFCWLSLAICIIELLICIKFGHGIFISLSSSVIKISSWSAKFFLFVASTILVILSCWKRIFVFLTGLYPNPMPLWLVIFWLCVGFCLVAFLIIWSYKSLQRKRRWFWHFGTSFFDSLLQLLWGVFIEFVNTYLFINCKCLFP